MSRWRPVVAYLVFALVFGAGLSVVLARQSHDRREAREQVCMTLVEGRQTLADIIGLAVTGGASERTQAFLNRTQERLSKPIDMCEQLDIDTSVKVRGAAPTTTTTTTVPAAGRRRAPSAVARTRPPARRSPATTRPVPTPRAGGPPSSSAVPPSLVPPTTACRLQVGAVTLVCR